jgi:hypothetical protein
MNDVARQAAGAPVSRRGQPRCADSCTRQPRVAGCSANPNSAWVTQQARQLAWSLFERPTPLRFLIHDRDSKFRRTFDAVFLSENLEMIRTPVRAPKQTPSPSALSAPLGAEYREGAFRS